MPASDWLDLCPQTIVWEAMTSRDKFAKPVYGGTPQTFRGRRVFKQGRVSGAGAKGVAVDFLTQSEIWILGTPDIGQEDRVYVQGDTTFPPIVLVQRFPDETGDVHVKVFLGKFTD